MKKKLLLGLLICATLCISTSCARKINGATPHRRDRNCGCENMTAPQCQDMAYQLSENQTNTSAK